MTQPAEAHETLQDAIRLAVEFHAGQIDKVGKPYILHPLAVMDMVATEEQKIVAVLHDIIEDTKLELGNLEQLGYTTEVIDAIDSVTRRQDETYKEFVTRASRNPIGRIVKLADARHNMKRSIESMNLFKSMVKRYEEAIDILEGPQ